MCIGKGLSSQSSAKSLQEIPMVPRPLNTPGRHRHQTKGRLARSHTMEPSVIHRCFCLHPYFSRHGHSCRNGGLPRVAPSASWKADVPDHYRRFCRNHVSVMTSHARVPLQRMRGQHIDVWKRSGRPPARKIAPPSGRRHLRRQVEHDGSIGPYTPLSCREVAQAKGTRIQRHQWYMKRQGKSRRQIERNIHKNVYVQCTPTI